VAVIGARECSEYGRFVASGLGKKMGECGIQVISGMARGIDGISQNAAMEAGGSSFAVLGCGVDICYPEQNRYIYDRLFKTGGIISEYPPGTPAVPKNFPPRNRIVSGLADVVVVVEARQKSGTLITVDMALEQGKDVYVVPGRVTDRLSDGCNKLIKQGAEIFLSPEDFVNEIMENHISRTKIQQTSKMHLDIRQTSIYENLPPDLKSAAEVLDFTPKDIETIHSAMNKTNTNKSMSEISTILMQLTLRGVAVQLTPGHFALKSDALLT
jgi:DNA processing protein